ncbi:MAG: N-acetylmuramoyl-L-alanine amidase [Selenomonadaceae bacterium]|nr:N-acetylmuramoyl-L-alanine amidase [Selenomonadaceae bacterium]
MVLKFLLATVIAQVLMFASNVTAAPHIVDKPVLWNDYREQLTLEYAETHYGKSITTIEPRAVVVHWTAGPTWESAYYTFYDETRADGSGTVNVSSQFIVDRDGTIYRTMPENKLARHVIGYNWCAIGIENVGGEGNVKDLTDEQLQANIELIRYLHEKYPTIEYVFGHYQQVAARESGLYIEHVDGYYSIKADPGEIFMRGLREALEGEGLKFF